jgi:hypothetical protein
MMKLGVGGSIFVCGTVGVGGGLGLWQDGWVSGEGSAQLLRDSNGDAFGAMSLIGGIVVKCFHLFGGSFEKFCDGSSVGIDGVCVCVLFFFFGGIAVETLSSSYLLL